MATKKLDDKLARKERDILWAAFRKHGTEPSLWARQIASKVSSAGWCSTMHHAAPTSLKTLLIMCHELEIPMATVKKMLIARGEDVIASMLKEDNHKCNRNTILDEAIVVARKAMEDGDMWGCGAILTDLETLKTKED